MSQVFRSDFIKAPKSIGAMLMAIVAALTAIVALLALERIGAGLSRYDDIRRLQAIASVTDNLLQASEALAFERDLTRAALGEADVGEAARLRTAAHQARDRAIAANAAALAGIQADPTLSPWSVRIGARLRALQDLRRASDRALDLAGEPSPALSARWASEVADYIGEADAIWLELVRPYSAIDATATQHLRYMRFLSSIYDHSGRERSLVADVLTSRTARASPAQLAELNHAQGVLDVSWGAARDLAVQGDFYDAVSGALGDAQSHYLALHGMLQEAFYTPDAQSTLPLSPTLWLMLSEQYSESLDHLRATSRTVAFDYLTSLRQGAQTAIAFQLAILVIAMGLCTACALVLSRFVVRPINAIVQALVGASRGTRIDFDEHLRNRRDEIGQLVEVLHVFEKQVETVRRTAANLDASEQRLRAILDNAIDGLITIDERGAIEAFNPASERLFGFKAEEAAGMAISVVMPDLFNGEDQSNDAPAPSSGPAFTLTAASAIETTGVRKDGSRFPIELTLSEINLAGASLLSALVRDISPRKLAEATLLAHTQALERSNKELDDFAYIASHDLKEPLRGLHNHARFLLEDNEGKLDEDSVRRLNRLVALTQRMERLVNDLLYFSRLGRQDLAVKPTDLSAVVRDIEGTLDHFLEEHGARILIPSALPTIVCDAPRVSELFRNLITNAVKYNDKSEKIVEIGARPGPTPRSAPVFYVRDNGAGIAKEFHQEVFRIFKRLNNHAVQSDGTGVGLTFVKKIVERHGGEIWIESSPGQGATFFFTLEPAHEERTSRAA